MKLNCLLPRNNLFCLLFSSKYLVNQIFTFKINNKKGAVQKLIDYQKVKLFSFVNQTFNSPHLVAI